MYNNIVYLIPAYKPDVGLLEIVYKLSNIKNIKIIVVDDGSGLKFSSIFSKLKKYNNVDLLHHSQNQGKGAALKLGFLYIIKKYAKINSYSVITLDADNQHSIKDILNISEEAQKKPNALILGVRKFDKNVPIRSRFGNIITAALLNFFHGINTNGDSQTGLRAIPKSLVYHSNKINGNNYDYETAFLISASNQGFEIKLLPIDTIYHNDNSSSHFKPILDSIKIFSRIFQYGIVGILSFLFELTFFSIMSLFFNVLNANVISRIFSMMFNFILLKKFVFKTQKKMKLPSLKYVILSLLNSLVTGLILLYAKDLEYSISIIILKLIIDFLLMLINFIILKYLVIR